MTAAAMLALLLAPQAPAPPAPPPACLPGSGGFLEMRLRGSIEAEIRWQGAELDCTGMSRPDGRGLRLRFAGPHAGGELAVVFAAPELAMGASARGVPVNVTLLDGAGERIYGTQGDRLCLLDEVWQQPLEHAALPPRSYRVIARGFCTAPARAVDGDGAVLLTRFDFAGRLTYRESEGAAVAAAAPAARPPAPLSDLPRSQLQVATSSGKHRLKVWIAADDASRERGLMFVRELPANHGMLFLFEQPQFTSFWMKDTYLALDLVFVAANGIIVDVATNATPHSLEPIHSTVPVKAVLEVPAGTADRLGLQPGDRILHPAFRDGR